MSLRPSSVDRPRMPAGYGVPDSDDGLIPWDQVMERLAGAKNYWLATAGTDGQPHVLPIWGAIMDGTLYVEGSPETRRGRDIERNPRVCVHLESGDEVVSIEGTAEYLAQGPGPELAERLAEAVGAKYAGFGYTPEASQYAEGGVWRIRPRLAFAWTRFPEDATRFRFAGPDEAPAT
jgi:hypothetical protein